jgi:exopolysaccharide biosynthesis polyprenyl glycosylphosphotransferase
MSNLYYNHLSKFIFLADFIFLNIALVIGHFLIFNSFDTNLASRIFVLLSNICWVLISFFNKNNRFVYPLNINNIIDKFLMTLIYQLLVVLGAIYFFKILNISRSFVIISFSAFFLLIITYRILLYFFLQKTHVKRYRKKITVLGNKNIADSLIATFSKHREYGYKLDEYISDDQIKKMTEDVLLDKLIIKKPNEIFVCYKEMNIELLDRLILFGDKNSIKIKVVFDLILSKRNNGDMIRYDNIPILHINSSQAISFKVRFLKRSFDILFSSVLMVVGAPLFLLLYILTKFTSSGPAFFKQERIGKNEKPFYIYKFRSMYVDAEKSGPQLSKDNDPRITKWGRMIRKTRLDELPQFWNVLKGEMSIVGYRPERKHYIEEIAKKTPEYKKLFHHKPGITSMGQVHYGYAENVDQMCERLKYDLLYARNVNLNSDVNIIFKTVKVMVQGKGK